MEALPGLIGECDYVASILPSTPETRLMVSAPSPPIRKAESVASAMAPVCEPSAATTGGVK